MQLLDVTNTVAIDDAAAVAAAVERILARSVGDDGLDRTLLHGTFEFARELYGGQDPDHLACDMPYHDLRHSLDTALVMARLVDGYQRGAHASKRFTAAYALLGVLLALLHDSGFIRARSESALCGAQLMREHEERGARLARAYLLTTSLAPHADALTDLILATRHDTDLRRLFDARERAAILLGQMLGTADLLSQVSDRHYLERCYYHLYAELAIAGYDRVRDAGGGEQILYRDAFDLVAKTARFYEDNVRKRFDEDFDGVRSHLSAHFDGADPYPQAVRWNLARCDAIVRSQRPMLLGREPPTTSRDFPPMRCASVGGAA
jgi:hypothetical protein